MFKKIWSIFCYIFNLPEAIMLVIVKKHRKWSKIANKICWWVGSIIYFIIAISLYFQKPNVFMCFWVSIAIIIILAGKGITKTSFSFASYFWWIFLILAIVTFLSVIFFYKGLIITCFSILLSIINMIILENAMDLEKIKKEKENKE